MNGVFFWGLPNLSCLGVANLQEERSLWLEEGRNGLRENPVAIKAIFSRNQRSLWFETRKV